MSNFIHDIEITNFKSIRHQKIEGCKRINVFIGYPNVGKSNILEALSLVSFSQPSTAKLSDLVRVQRFSELFFDGNISLGATVECNSKEMFRLVFMGDDKIHLDYFTHLHKKAEPNVVGSVDSSDWQEYSSLTFENGESPKISESRETRDAVAKQKYSRLLLKKYQFYHEKEKDQVGYTSLFYPYGQNLFYILEVNSTLRKQVAELFKEYNLKLAFEKGDKYSLKILKNLNDETIFLLPFHQIADTIQRLIFHKAAIASNKDTVLLFEEPEAHMFPPYISKFTADVMFNENGNQFFINTHSPFVINDFMENLKSDELSIYVVGYKKSSGETVIRKLTEEELQEIYQYGIDLYYNLESYLEHEEQ